ncbi:recombinase family protein [uncultured Thiodictyon sp.]|jgi:DNA invertase Pin-like site-specific DNA recombinase|uniref:recombinase family protein n=1 Tax=uncultured Thiodictyon sp. TaxID=1846217 RepID=UPI0025F01A47|nr:recombinase family protein [uncultured Thiodictyon sp.]
MPHELITPSHLARRAVIYIRQSSPHQVLTNQESLRLQYALRSRALELGWHEADIQVIDSDLGLTAASAQHREGFKELLSQVTLGQVGLILSIDVTRLSRNCSDWYPLLDLCGYKQCLIGERDGLYDPGTPNGRLLLGLKGQISELELHTIRLRLTAGLLNKAERGELALTLPVGLVREPQGTVVKDPNREVQARVALVFETFLTQHSAAQVVRVLREQALTLPRRDRFGDITWRRPSVASVVAILRNPAYAGAFVYGRTRTERSGPGPQHARQRRLPINEWKVCVKDKYPSYISWDTFERIQAMLQDNYAEYDRNKTRGIPRPGQALLQGLVYCGVCGHKMVIQYKGGAHYLCNYLRQQFRESVCQYIPANPIDEAVIAAFFAALAPVEFDAYTAAMAERHRTQQALQQARAQQLQRLRYQLALAERQFLQVDPDNRLVAAELESRWEQALREVRDAEQALAQETSCTGASETLDPQLKAAFTTLGQQLPTVWDQLAREQQKAFLRCLIDKVVLQRTASDQVHLRLVWKGEQVTTLDIPLPVGSLAEYAQGTAMTERILALFAEGRDDAEMAEMLTREGFRSPMGTTVLPSTVKTIRLRHGCLQTRHQSHPRRIVGYLTVPQVAERLAVPRHWLYDRLHNGTIELAPDPVTRLYLFPDNPSTLEQLHQLREGQLNRVRFSQEHQDA